MYSPLVHALRLARRAPAVVCAAVVALAIGIAGNTIIFSVVDAALLRALPYDRPDRLVSIEEYSPQSDPGGASYDDYLDWRGDRGPFEDLAVGNWGTFNLTGPAGPEQVFGANVSASLFRVLHVAPFMGRLFVDEDESSTAAPVVIVTFDSWRDRYQRDPAIIGRTVVLDRVSRTIVGVLPPRVRYPVVDRNREFFLPIGRLAGEIAGRGRRRTTVIARLADNVTIGQARAAMDTVATNLARLYPDTNRDVRIRVEPFSEELVASSRTMLIALWGAVGLVLVVGCANAATLIGVLGIARTREFAIRLALGARRADLLRQLLGESLTLSVAAGILGVILASIGLPAVVAVLPGGLPNVADIDLDRRVLAVASAVSLMTGVLAGILPAWQASRTSVFHAANARHTALGVRPRLRAALVVGQLAATQALLIASGLLISTLVYLVQTSPGFDADRVVVAMYYLPEETYTTYEQMVGFHRALIDGVAGLPRVAAVGLLTPPPFGFGESRLDVRVEGRPEPVVADYFRASPGVPAALRIAIVAGRFFDDRDRREATTVAVVDDRFAKAYLAGADPIGRRVRVEGSTDWLSIVGVVRHIATRSIGDAGRPQVYQPLLATSTHFTAIMVRTTSTDPMVVMPEIRAVAQRLDPDLPLFNGSSMENLIGHAADRQRFAAYTFAAYAAAAWVLAGLALAGAIGHAVTTRRKELGIRLALGAEPRGLIRRVLLQGACLTMLGLGLGLGGGLMAARALTSLLVGVQPFDPRVLLLASSALLSTGLLASYLPARKISSVDPVESLKE